jgi:hypothetical protein
MGGGSRFVLIFGIPSLLLFAHEPDWAGGAVFTIELWVFAFQTGLT